MCWFSKHLLNSICILNTYVHRCIDLNFFRKKRNGVGETRFFRRQSEIFTTKILSIPHRFHYIFFFFWSIICFFGNISKTVLCKHIVFTLRLLFKNLKQRWVTILFSSWNLRWNKNSVGMHFSLPTQYSFVNVLNRFGLIPTFPTKYSDSCQS